MIRVVRSGFRSGKFVLALSVGYIIGSTFVYLLFR